MLRNAVRTNITVWVVVGATIGLSVAFCSDERTGPSPAYEHASIESAKRTCRMIRDRGGISPTRCEATIERQIGELAKAQGTVRRCAATQVHQIYHYVLSGESEEMAKVLAYEDMKDRC